MEFTFGDFTLSTKRLQLLKRGAPLPLEPQVFALLRLLVENSDRVVTRDEIFDVIWKGRVVSDSALSSRIKVARAVLGDDGARQAMIRTVHGKGFHFVGTLEDPSHAPEHTELPKPPTLARPSLALLPLEMFEPDTEQRNFGEGLADDIATALRRIKALHVATNHGDKDPRRIAMDLGVRYLLSTRLRFSGSAYRLNASLLDSTRMEEVWADQFKGTIDDPFQAQDEVTAAVLGVLVPNLVMLEVRRAALANERDAKTAYTEVMRAIPFCLTTTGEDNRKALELLKSAITRDPNYGLAHALISWCRGQEIAYLWSDDPHASRTAVQHHAKLALNASPSDSMVLTFVAHAESLSRNPTAAEHHVRTALEIDPNSAWAWSRLGFVHAFVGRLDEAEEAFEKSLQLSPLDPMRHSVYFGLGASHFFRRDFETALRWFDHALIENPNMIWAHRAVAACAAELGDHERAERSVKIVRAYLPEATADSLAQAIPTIVPEFRDQLASSYRKAGF